VKGYRKRLGAVKIEKRRLGVGALAVLLLAACMTSLRPATQPTQAAPSGTGHTTVAIQGTRFLVNGELTSPGKPAEGMIVDRNRFTKACDWGKP